MWYSLSKSKVDIDGRKTWFMSCVIKQANIKLYTPIMDCYHFQSYTLKETQTPLGANYLG